MPVWKQGIAAVVLCLSVILLLSFFNAQPPGSQPGHTNPISLGQPVPVEVIQAVEDEPAPVQSLMTVKLTESHAIMAGLIEEDFPKIERSSQELLTLSLASSWHVYQTPEYMKDSEKFRGHVKALKKSAREKKLNECTEHYVNVVRSCVKCHDNVRRGSVVNARP